MDDDVNGAAMDDGKESWSAMSDPTFYECDAYQEPIGQGGY
jgi:hypothetical protein